MADGGGSQFFAQHGDGVQLVGAGGRAGAGNREGGAWVVLVHGGFSFLIAGSACLACVAGCFCLYFLV